MRVLVTGSRQVLDQHTVYAELDLAYREWNIRQAEKWPEGDEVFTVVHGGAPGADTLANQWGHDMAESGHRVAVEVHTPNWGMNGRGAGLLRNTKMVRLGADLVIAFFQTGAGNVGTTDCVNKARDFLGWRGVPIKEVWCHV
jgi:hypothetical protein